MRNIKAAGLEGELQKLVDDVESMENISGGTFAGGTIDLTLSYILGNKGWVCTWTCECQSNCS